jgi:hypothetical protein
MVRYSENKIWRIVARVDDEIIVKSANSIERAVRSARNAVCKRLCDAAGIQYEKGWWKGWISMPRRAFVENFLGEPLYVLIEEELDIDAHSVPYEVYTIQAVREVFKNVLMMCPDDIDSWGNYHWGEGDSDKVLLLGSDLPIPSAITFSGKSESEEVLAIGDAQESFDKCPHCKGVIPFGTIVLITENYRLIPANCCGEMMWIKEDDTKLFEEWE